jgi:hypothetical protein
MNPTRIALAFTLLLAGALAGCVTAIPVPVHAARPPQTLGRNVLQFDLVKSSNPVVGPDLAQYGVPAPTDFKTDDSLFNFSVRFGVRERLDLEYETTTTVSSGSTSVYGVKYQWLGKSLFESREGQWIASLRVKYLEADGDRDDTEDSFYGLLDFNELKGHALGAQQSIGYQFTDWLVFSLGANWHRFTLHSRFDEDSSGEPYEDRRHVTLLGANASLCGLPRWRKVACMCATNAACSACNGPSTAAASATYRWVPFRLESASGSSARYRGARFRSCPTGRRAQLPQTAMAFASHCHATGSA